MFARESKTAWHSSESEDYPDQLRCMPATGAGKGQFIHSMPCPCRALAYPLPFRASKGLECVFPI